MYEASCLQGVPPVEFWGYTLREVQLLIRAGQERDKAMWNHTTSLMSLYANSKASKGKSFTPQDFNPYEQSTSNQPTTKEQVAKMVEEMKSFN